MTDLEAINTICSSGNLSAEGLNALHACRDGHPWHGHPRQWTKAMWAIAGRGPWHGAEWEAVEVIERNAARETA